MAEPGVCIFCFVQGRLITYCSQQALHTLFVTSPNVSINSSKSSPNTQGCFPLSALDISTEIHPMRWVCRMELLPASQFGNVRTATYFHWDVLQTAFITYLFTDLSARKVMMLMTTSFQALYLSSSILKKYFEKDSFSVTEVQR